MKGDKMPPIGGGNLLLLCIPPSNGKNPFMGKSQRRMSPLLHHLFSMLDCVLLPR